MLENLTPKSNFNESKVDRVLSVLEPRDQELLLGYLHDTLTWSPNGLSRALAERDIQVSGDTIRRYRQRNKIC